MFKGKVLKVSLTLSILFFLLFVPASLAANTKFLPSKNTDVSKTAWTIKFKKDIDKSSINNSTVYVVQESTGKPINCTFSFPDSKTVEIKLSSPIKLNENYTVTVTEEVKSLEGKKLNASVKQTFTAKKISKAINIPNVSVEQGQQPVLPESVDIQYSDNTVEKANIVWGTVDTSKPGLKTVTGKIKGCNYQVTINVDVKQTEYIQNISTEYHSTLGVYEIRVNALDGVSKVMVNNYQMYYDGNGMFSIAMALKPGTNAAFKAYDSDGNLLFTKQYVVQ